MSDEKLGTLLLSGPVLNNSGYGRHATDIACSLLRYGKYDLKIAFQPWGMCPTVNLDEERLTNPYTDQLLGCMLKENLKEQPEVFMQITIPSEFNPVGKYNIGVTAGIESTAPSGYFIEGVNRMNRVIMPSNFSKEVFTKIKIEKVLENGQKIPLETKVPIDVIFEGCNTNIFKPTSNLGELGKLLDTIEEDFCYLFVGHWLQGDIGHDRKDVGTLVKLFFEIFKDRKKKPALILKTSGAIPSIPDRYEIESKIQRIREMITFKDLPNIYLLHGELSDTEMNQLFNHGKIKAMVNLTHGEGFNRSVLEFSMTGKPIIISGWSGHLDFLPKEYVELIPGTLENVHHSAVNEWLIKEGKMFYVNQSFASKIIRDVYINYEKYRQKAYPLRKINKEKFSMDAFDKVFWEFLDKNIPKFPKKQEMKLPKLKFIK